MRASMRVCDMRRQTLDQVEARARGDLDGQACGVAVGDRVAQAVGLARQRRARDEHEVEHEALAVLALVLVHAVVGVHARARAPRS